MSLKSFPKGQKEPKADWRAIDSPKKQTNKFVLFFATTHSKLGSPKM